MLLTASLAISACGVKDRPEQSIAEVERLMVSTVTASADHLGVGDWEQSGGRPMPRNCSEPHTARFSWTLKTDPGRDPLADAKKMMTYWESLGMRAGLVEGTHPAVYAQGGDVTAIAFETDTFLYTISGSSLCADGDAADLEDRPILSPIPIP